MAKSITIGTRSSPLALTQTELARAALLRVYPALDVRIAKITTSGDQKPDFPLLKQTLAGVKGLFTKELEEALLRGEIDLAVHSCKDLPGEMLPGLRLAAVLERASTADILITKTAGPLPHGATIGTCSLRRARQLQWRRPDLVIEDIRGNIATRLRKLCETAALHGIVLAQAGLDRLGYRMENGSLETDEGTFAAVDAKILPAIGQGAIALQSRAEDASFFTSLNHEPTWQAVRAERELMRLLNGDCTLPLGVATEIVEGQIQMRAHLFGPTEAPPRQAEVTGDTPETVAARAFELLI